MSTPITDGLPKDLFAQPDMIFDNVALASSGAITSESFLLGNTNGRAEIKLLADTVHTLVAPVTIEIQTSPDNVTFTTIATEVLPLGLVTAVGDDLYQFIMPKEKTGQVNTKMIITTTADESALKVTSGIVFLRRGK